jgi:hypothetical protein
MTASRYVRADIVAKNLNPGNPWHFLDKGGHLTATPKTGAKREPGVIYAETNPAAEQTSEPVKVAPGPVHVKPIEVAKAPEKPAEKPAVVATVTKAPEPVKAPEAPAVVETAKPEEKPADEKPVS